MPRTFSRATRLGQRMHVLGFQVGELSAVTGLNRWLLNDYLQGRKVPSPASMQKLCQALSCEPELLIDPQ